MEMMDMAPHTCGNSSPPRPNIGNVDALRQSTHNPTIPQLFTHYSHTPQRGHVHVHLWALTTSYWGNAWLNV